MLELASSTLTSLPAFFLEGPSLGASRKRLRLNFCVHYVEDLGTVRDIIDNSKHENHQAIKNEAPATANLFSAILFRRVSDDTRDIRFHPFLVPTRPSIRPSIRPFVRPSVRPFVRQIASRHHLAHSLKPGPTPN